MDRGRDHANRHAVWIGSCIIAAALTAASKYYPYFPGDVTVERGVQSLFSTNLNWAEGVSRTVELPWVLLILVIVCALSRGLAGWRAPLLAILSLLGVWGLGALLGPVIARPRPSPELVRVFRPLTGYSFPSLFALRFAATFGFLGVLALMKSSGALRAGLSIGCGALLLLGFAARVALGAHWPSDVALSYLIGLLWASLLVHFA